jgi:hypothetical protein
MTPESSQPEQEKQQNEKLLRLMTGYGRHASPPLNSNIAILLNPFQHLGRKYASFPMHSVNLT